MKRSLLVVVTLMFCMFGVMPANAADVTDIPNGEEFAITLTVPSAPNGCAYLPGDISGVDDIYYPYLDTMEHVAKYTIVEDAEGFIITATLQNKYYSLINPLEPVRSQSATFSIPRCEERFDLVAPETTVVIPHGEPAPPVEPTVVEEVSAPAEVIVAPADIAPVAPQVETPQAVTEAPVASEEVVVASTPVPELAATGAKENVAVVGFIVLFVGLGMVLLNRKIAV